MNQENRNKIIKAIASGKIEIVRENSAKPGGRVFYAKTFLDLLTITSSEENLQGVSLHVSSDLQAWLDSVIGSVSEKNKRGE